MASKVDDDESKADRVRELVVYLVHERTTPGAGLYREVVDPFDGLVVLDRQYVKRAALARLEGAPADEPPQVLEVTVRAITREELREALGG